MFNTFPPYMGYGSWQLVHHGPPLTNPDALLTHKQTAAIRASKCFTWNQRGPKYVLGEYLSMIPY